MTLLRFRFIQGLLSQVCLKVFVPPEEDPALFSSLSGNDEGSCKDALCSSSAALFPLRSLPLSEARVSACFPSALLCFLCFPARVVLSGLGSRGMSLKVTEAEL